MANKVRTGKLIYHLTAIDNIENIIKNGLMPRSMLMQENFVDVADQEIIEIRNLFSINDYVPFHFFVKNPFDGSVLIKRPDLEFAYITMTRERAKQLNFKILPKHPLAMEEMEIFDFDEGLNSINWEALELRDYFQPESKNSCMAECIHKGIITTSNFYSIVVRYEETKLLIESLCKKHKCNITFYINVEEHWFAS